MVTFIDLCLSLKTIDEAQNDRSKESIRAKCIQYLDRAEKLKQFIADDKKKPAKAAAGGGSGKYES